MDFTATSPDHIHIGMFFSTPELVLHLCQVLADDDLLVLSQVSRQSNRLALQSFFVFHGMALSQISTGIFSISSLSLPAFRLALFIPPLIKLSCTFDAETVHADISALLRVLSRHPPIQELNFSVDMHTTNQEFLPNRPFEIVRGAISQLLFGLGAHKNFFFILPPYGRCYMSKRRRMERTIEYPEFPIATRSIWLFMASTPLICLYWLGYVLTEASARVATVLYDPRIRTRQDERIHRDIYVSTDEFPNSGIVRITTPMLSSPSFTKWSMVTFAESSLKSLQIEHISFLDDEKWHSILSSLYLPHLEFLNIEPNSHISLTTLSAFINRHPTIQYLQLGHYSILYSSYPSSQATLSPHCLDQLEFVCASSRLIHHLLQSTKFPKLRYICIGPKTQLNDSGRFPDKRAKVEEPFDFAALDRTLVAVKDCGYSCGSVSVGVALPGGSVAKKWLARKHDPTLSATGSLFKLHVGQIMIATERGIPLNPSLVLLLADWVVGMFLTHELKKVRLARWVIVDPGLQVVFGNKIVELAGHVEVDFNIDRLGL